MFDHGTTVTLHAAPAEGWRVAGWADPACGRRADCAVVVDGDRTVVVTFEQIPLRVLAVIHDGEGTITSPTPAGISCGGACTGRFPEGTSVKLRAEPAAGWKLVGWVGADCRTDLDCTVELSANRTVAAHFERIKPRYIVNVVLLGSGTVTITPGPTVCKVTCLAAFDQGTAVGLRAEPAAGWRFDGWTTDASAKACAQAVSCSFPLSERVNLTARFAPAASPPVLGKTGLASVEAGTVGYWPPASAVRRLLAGDGFIALTGQQDIPVGSLVDASKGRLRLTIQDAKRRERSIVLEGGVFRFTQPAAGRAKGVANLRLIVARTGACKRSPARVLQRLVAAGGTGFRTAGRYAAATAAKPATWAIEERCAGTRVAVKRGSVSSR